MKREIKQFNTAWENLQVATKKLNKVVGEKLSNTDNIPDLQDLIDSLPKNYSGLRRIYEKIEQIDEKIVKIKFDITKKSAKLDNMNTLNYIKCLLKLKEVRNIIMIFLSVSVVVNIAKMGLIHGFSFFHIFFIATTIASAYVYLQIK